MNEDLRAKEQAAAQAVLDNRLTSSSGNSVKEKRSTIAVATNHPNASTKQEGMVIKTLLKFASGVAFASDLVTIYLFIIGLFKGDSVISPSQGTISLGIAVILIFMLALSFIKLSGGVSDWFYVMSGMLYASYSAVFLALAVQYFITNQIGDIYRIADIYRTADFIIVAIVTSLFSYIVMNKSSFGIRWAAVPYVIASLYQLRVLLPIYYDIVFYNKGGVPLLVHVFFLLEIGIMTVFFRKLTISKNR